MIVNNNKTAFVTGGGKRIGTAIVKRFTSEGYRVVFTYSSSAAKAQQLEEELFYAGKEVKAIQVDITDTAAIKFAIKRSVRNMVR